jgi:hypothetical protein
MRSTIRKIKETTYLGSGANRRAAGREWVSVMIVGPDAMIGMGTLCLQWISKMSSKKLSIVTIKTKMDRLKASFSLHCTSAKTENPKDA